MVLARVVLVISCLLVYPMGIRAVCQADDLQEVITPLLRDNCITCHGDAEVNGEVNFQELATTARWTDRPSLIVRAIKAIDTNKMPPEGEPSLTDADRQALLTALRKMLRKSASGHEPATVQIRRLNRFQYNHAVRDLFRLQRDVFQLPEKLMTRHDDYLRSARGKMPKHVRVASHALHPKEGLRGVRAFPKDLRAAHGFDNQANQLTLSPLLLDAFLRLSLSIVESPDFNEQSVGIWRDFFEEPPRPFDAREAVRDRLRPFLRIAFRKKIDDVVLDRYASYALSKLDQGLSFTTAMKKVASAAIC